MSLLRRALETRSMVDPPFDGYGQGGWWSQGMGAWFGPNRANAEQSMRLSAVYACIRLLSEAISTLPIDTFSRANGVRKPYRPRPDYLNFAQPGLSRIDYFSQVMLSLLTAGDAYVLTPRQADGTVIELAVSDPSRMVVEKKRGQLRYTNDGTELDPVYDLMHIKGMCLPGHITGVSPIVYAAETVGVGLNAQRFGASFFNNGATPSMALVSPNKVDKVAAERWRDEWNEGHQGAGNANKIAVMGGGVTLNKVSVSPEEAQFLQTRQFTVPDVARIYGVPPHLIADASNSTSWGTGLSEQNIAFGQYSLRPWIERIEEAHGRLLTLDGLPDVFLKLNMDAVLRASLKDRYEAYAIAIQNEWMVPNDVCRLEDEPPKPWGNVPPPTVRREVVTPADSNVTPQTGPAGPATAPGPTPVSNGAKP